MNKQIERDLVYLVTVLKQRNFSVLPLAFIATEMHFRGSAHRTLEYLYWVLLWLVRSKRIELLSVGIAQIQLRYWKRFGFINTYSPSVSNILAISDARINYSACKRYCEVFALDNDSSLTEISLAYTGLPRKYYSNVLGQAIAASNEIALTFKSSRCQKVPLSSSFWRG